MIDISKKIKDLRLEKNLKQKEVAKALNIATNTLSQFENNNGRPSLEVLSSMADFYNVSVDYLIGRTDDFGNVVVKESQILSKNEEKLVNSFRNLSESEQEKLLSDAEFYSKRNK